MCRMSGSKKIHLAKFTFLFFVFLFLNKSFAKILLVGTTQKYQSIKQAIAVAATGDTVLVNSGYYSEGTIILTKSITILGKDYPVISGEGKTEILLVKADGIIIKGITFSDAGLSFIHDNAAIKLDNVKDCVIEKNKFKNNFFGIYLAKSHHCKIINNEISSSSIRETYSGNGIHLWYCRNITIINNHLRGHRDGIYLEFVRKSLIENNFSEKNVRYGLHFMFSDSCNYSNNIFIKNGAGVAVMYTHNVTMTGNRFEQNWGGGAYGLLLKEISDSKIENNYFYKNSSGIYLEGCTRIKSSGNNFVENGWAVRLMANSMENIFERNNFIGNTFDISTNSIKNYNTFNNNYWSEYKGYDLNKDGIGDVPYHPVKLFSVITERNRPILILLRSFFIELLNIAENIFPTLTPETLIDNKPAMRKFL